MCKGVIERLCKCFEFRDMTPIMENQMDKELESYMEMVEVKLITDTLLQNSLVEFEGGLLK